MRIIKQDERHICMFMSMYVYRVHFCSHLFEACAFTTSICYEKGRARRKHL